MRDYGNWIFFVRWILCFYGKCLVKMIGQIFDQNVRQNICQNVCQNAGQNVLSKCLSTCLSKCWSKCFELKMFVKMFVKLFVNMFCQNVWPSFMTNPPTKNDGVICDIERVILIHWRCNYIAWRRVIMIHWGSNLDTLKE